MQKNYTSLGLMSGTSGDGVDASIINSNGIDHFEVIQDKYFEYDSSIYKAFHSLKKKIYSLDDLKKFSKEIRDIERKITLFHAKIIKGFDFSNNENELVGFHGQTIYHNSKEKVSTQLGDGKLLNQLTKKKIIFNFRQKDLLNGGEGAPLTPLFHQLIISQQKINSPICILNIGGIANITLIKKPVGLTEIYSKDIGPGNCLIDEWVRNNCKQKYDIEGELASLGNVNEIIFEQAQELYSNRKNKEKISYDINDFDISFSRGLSLEDGAATLTKFTANIIGETISLFLKKEFLIKNILICGGGRKNKVLLKNIAKYFNSKINIRLIDDYGLDGDFIESQAFAFLAIRSFINQPISYRWMTGCKKDECKGGKLITFK